MTHLSSKLILQTYKEKKKLLLKYQLATFIISIDEHIKIFFLFIGYSLPNKSF